MNRRPAARQWSPKAQRSVPERQGGRAAGWSLSLFHLLHQTHRTRHYKSTIVLVATSVMRLRRQGLPLFTSEGSRSPKTCPHPQLQDSPRAEEDAEKQGKTKNRLARISLWLLREESCWGQGAAETGRTGWLAGWLTDMSVSSLPCLPARCLSLLLHCRRCFVSSRHPRALELLQATSKLSM